MKMTKGIRQVMVVDEEIYRWAFISLLCAALALVIAPFVFGPLGVVTGVVAIWKGGRWWGAAGASASAVTGVFGFYLAVGLIA